MVVKREHRIFIQCSAFIALICAVIVTTSLATDNWIVGTVKAVKNNDSNVENSSINYGLFKGLVIRSFATGVRTSSIYLTCMWDLNVCIWSCQQYTGLRKAEIKKLLNNEKLSPCPSLPLVRSSYIRFINDKVEKQFLNSGMFLSTTIFVVLTMIFLYCSLILAIVNCYMSPIIPLLNINGIVTSSCIAFLANLIGIIIFGFNYGIWISKNIGTTDTIVGDYESIASIGYSTWLFVSTCFIIPLSIVLLHTRTIILMKSLMNSVIVKAKINDPTAILY